MKEINFFGVESDENFWDPFILCDQEDGTCPYWKTRFGLKRAVRTGTRFDAKEGRDAITFAYNILTQDGRELLDRWVDYIDDFDKYGVAKMVDGSTTSWITTLGKIYKTRNGARRAMRRKNQIA